MPVWMNDISQTAPEEQKEKIKKLVDIWEKGQTFPAPMLESFRQKLAPAAATTTTPPGSPPAAAIPSHPGQAAPPAAADGSSILSMLANMARQSSAGSHNTSQPPAAVPSYAMPGPGAAAPAPAPPAQVQSSYLPMAQPVNAQPMPFSFPQGMPQNNAPMRAPSSHNAMPSQFNAPAAPPAAGIDNNTQQQILLIKALADQGIPFDRIPAIIQSMTNGAGVAAPGMPPAAAAPYSSAQQQPWAAAVPNQQRDHDRGYNDNHGGRSPPRHRGRSRSNSPDRWDRGGRDGRGNGRNSPPRDSNGRRGGNDYRQRSPPGRRGRSATPDLPHVERWVEYDRSLPSGSIKVLSRTLFVGGVTCSEAELRNIFGRFGTVQTCIVNKDKRHAFVKMLTRRDAENARSNMEHPRDLDIPLRTRWGVGFGPRDCSDYATGISIIPITKLTEADRKWMLTAPYGGSGGRPIESGLCVEEPDIEIGAGVSSKAISRRMQTDKGGSHGPKSTKRRDGEWNDDQDGGNRRGGRGGRGGQYRGDAHDSGNGDGQGMPGFPFGVGTLPNGMPSFPPGFSFPDPGRHN
ncbi:hypothetical protein VHEMI01743 [[Torrubiella] hemipterigena]|nr:hypothetical protein VHEMI01743 [[Torrubiella] hemipterigena]